MFCEILGMLVLILDLFWMFLAHFDSIRCSVFFFFFFDLMYQNHALIFSGFHRLLAL